MDFVVSFSLYGANKTVTVEKLLPLSTSPEKDKESKESSMVMEDKEIQQRHSGKVSSYKVWPFWD